MHHACAWRKQLHLALAVTIQAHYPAEGDCAVPKKTPPFSSRARHCNNSCQMRLLLIHNFTKSVYGALCIGPTRRDPARMPAGIFFILAGITAGKFEGGHTACHIFGIIILIFTEMNTRWLLQRYWQHFVIVLVACRRRPTAGSVLTLGRTRAAAPGPHRPHR